jgi:hypothetical protein
MSDKHWAVEVFIDGDSVLRIESDCLSGNESFSRKEQTVIREAANHLLAFIGRVTCMCGAELAIGEGNICEGCANDATGFV